MIIFFLLIFLVTLLIPDFFIFTLLDVGEIFFLSIFLDEAERSLHDALAVLSQLVKDGRVVLGAGVAEMAMAESVDTLARSIGGKKSLAVEAFAKTLRQIPTIILDNGGFDSAEIVAKLRAAHHAGDSHMGIGKRQRRSALSGGVYTKY